MPDAASYARKRRSRAPLNTRPPAEVNKELAIGARWRIDQTTCPFAFEVDCLDAAEIAVAARLRTSGKLYIHAAGGNLVPASRSTQL